VYLKTRVTDGTLSRKPQHENLSIHRQLIDLPEAQKEGLVKIREEITEQIEYERTRTDARAARLLPSRQSEAGTKPLASEVPRP
jgi:hypothetical protein